MMNYYTRLLTYIKSAVTRNYSEKSINSILDYISTSKKVCRQFFSLHYVLVIMHCCLVVTPSLLSWLESHKQNTVETCYLIKIFNAAD